MLDALLHGQPNDTVKQLSDQNSIIRRTIEQQNTWEESTIAAFSEAKEALTIQLDLLRRLYDSSNGRTAYVPDTNALLHNPAIDNWIFSEVSQFTLVLVPAILSELDALKINHRNEVVRQKAEKLIREIKEYRRRGNLIEGVTVVKNKIDIVGIATEPNMDISLPWFDSENTDDRFLASVIEVMRGRPRSPVIIVSRDINLQNKAEFAHLSFVEPPDPA